MEEKRIGVYICHCGGNISDYVDVEKVKEAVKDEPGVVIAKTTMFACSDSAQIEMIEDIKNHKLNGLVVASCSPKLHLLTFRGTAKRAGLNPYQYIQVNIREQDSWAHTDDCEGATEKAIRLVRAGIAKARLAQPLEPIEIETVSSVLVVGGGITGLRAALGLADLGLNVYLIERKSQVGGWVAKWGRMFPYDRTGKEIIESLLNEIKKRENIVIYTEAELIEKTGCVGDFTVKIKVKGEETISLRVGAIIVATGFDLYKPKEGEFGYGNSMVTTLDMFKEVVDNSKDGLFFNGKEIKSVVYIYCVGSRQQPGEDANLYCSRYCCNATIHTSIIVSEKDPEIKQFHLYRDLRTYGKFETLFEKARRDGTIFIKYPDNEPPKVEQKNGKVIVRVKDVLTENEELEVEADLVVLVTGMVPNKNDALISTLKLPIGKDGFFNEIHPKLRPVETVLDGILIAGTAQGPKNSIEAVASALAAVSKAGALLKKGYVELEPQIAFINTELCEWCGKCSEACPFSAIEKVKEKEKEVGRVIEALCKGCGACVPVCPVDAIYIKGYTDGQIKEMIDALLKEVKIG